MNKTFHTGGNLDKCTVVGNNHYLAFYLVAYLHGLVKRIPRVGSKLLETKGNALLVFIKVEDNHVDFLIEANNFFRMVDATPRKVGNMYKTINTTKVNKYTIRGNILNSTFEYLSFFKFGNDFSFLDFKFSFDQGLVRHHYVLVFVVDLHNLELHGFAYVYIIVANGLYINLRTGQKSLDTEYIDNKATFCTAFHETINDLVIIH